MSRFQRQKNIFGQATTSLAVVLSLTSVVSSGLFALVSALPTCAQTAGEVASQAVSEAVAQQAQKAAQLSAAKKSPTDFPDLIDAKNKKPPHGKSTLPFMISLARRPDLMHPQYLRMVLGSPDQARGYSYPANNFSWSATDLSKLRYSLSRTMGGGDKGGAVGYECRQFIVAFGQSKIRLRDLHAQLGKPTRRYYDNRAQPVELYQISPTTTLAACEPTNTFDIDRITVSYTGPVLAGVGPQDLLDASIFRQEQIDHHLDKGSGERGLALLQEHVDDNPEDIEAHLLMANSLKRRSDVNGSIAEYRRALALAQGSNDLPMQKKALNGLRQFGLIPQGSVSTVSVAPKADTLH